MGDVSWIFVRLVAGGLWGVRDLLKGQSLTVRLPTLLCIFGDLQVKARCVIHQARRMGRLRDSWDHHLIRRLWLMHGKIKQLII